MEVDAIKVFSRDAIGRQSMSEKRKGHIDPRTSSFYQQIKITKGNQSSNLMLQSNSVAIGIGINPKPDFVRTNQCDIKMYLWPNVLLVLGRQFRRAVFCDLYLVP